MLFFFIIYSISVFLFLFKKGKFKWRDFSIFIQNIKNALKNPTSLFFPFSFFLYCKKMRPICQFLLCCIVFFFILRQLKYRFQIFAFYVLRQIYSFFQRKLFYFINRESIIILFCKKTNERRCYLIIRNIHPFTSHFWSF